MTAYRIKNQFDETVATRIFNIKSKKTCFDP